MASSTASGEDDDFSYYAILNVERDASDDDIKKAFRQLAQAYHPDKHTDPALQAHASSNFMRLQEAYEVCLCAYDSALSALLLPAVYVFSLCRQSCKLCLCLVCLACSVHLQTCMPD